jgi:hypothetical protein
MSFCPLVELSLQSIAVHESRMSDREETKNDFGESVEILPTGTVRLKESGRIEVVSGYSVLKLYLKSGRLEISSKIISATD